MRSVCGWAAGLALVLAGCSSDGFLSMHRDVDALEEHVGEVRAETQAHADAMAGAADLTAAMTEENRHLEAMQGHGDSMDEVMDHMGSCHDGQGDPPDTTSMHDSMEDMLEECTDHMAVMGSAGNMSDAHSEEGRHQDAMDTMLDGMESMMDSMMGGAGDYECPGGMMGGG